MTSCSEKVRAQFVLLPPARSALIFSSAIRAPEKRVVAKGVSGRPEDRGAPLKAFGVLSLAVFPAS